ncbi:MAG: alpha/beta fold hydrolase [Anaerolineae bacterium]|nr:alpha/beta fold hydrolase [Anaerolineae bacterium]
MKPLRWLGALIGVVFGWLGLLQGQCVLRRLDGLSLAGRNRVAGIVLTIVLGLCGIILIAFSPLLLVFLFILPALLPALAILIGLGWLRKTQLEPPLAGSPAVDDPWTAEPISFPDQLGTATGWFLKSVHSNGATVCWVHGVGDNSQTYKWVILRALAGAGFNVLTVDLPGHGARQDRFSLPGALGTVPAALAYLRGRPDVNPDRVGLLGVSLGGMLSIRALAGGAQVKTAVLLQVPCELHLSQKLWWTEALSAISLPTLNVFRRSSPRGLYRTWTPLSDFDPSLEAVINALHPEDYIGDALPLPLLFVYGGRDHVAPIEHGLCILEPAKQPKSFRIVRAASHVSLIFMQETAGLVRDWFINQL